MDHPASLGAAPAGREDLNERNLRAEFGSPPCREPKKATNRFRRRKKIAVTVTTINPQQLAELCKNGKIELIDVRTTVEFRELHAAVARNVPLDRLDPTAIMQARNGSKDEPLYLICRSGSRGRQACEKFLAAGFTNVVNIEGGTQACVEGGLPVVRGKKAISLERQVRIAAGSLVLLGVLLGWLVHPVFFGLAAFVGAGLVFAGITDTCGMGMMLARMPWNQGKDTPATCATKEVCSGR
jgi:rhodanese-related sulfurtransferase